MFTGFVHQKELYKYYNIADIAVIPSLFQDPAPLVCIEAQATGTPLMATKVGGIPEYIDNKGTILIEKNEKMVENLSRKIEQLLNDDKLREIMKERSKENALRYSVNHYYEKFNLIIEEIEKDKKNV